MNALVRQHLLPLNSTPLERAVSETLDRTPELPDGTEALHAFKYRLPNDSILPWLVLEYGLGPITPYFASLADVVAHGIPWSRVKGTPKAIEQALDWLGYAYTTLDEAPTRRRRWHLFGLELDRFWDRESDLDIIEAVGRLSQPARSEFFRGWNGYDVRGLEWSYSRLGDSMIGDSSGVRLHDGGVKWSFGRVHEMPGSSTDLTMRQLEDLGVWTMPTGSGALGWGAFPWDTPGLTWNSSGAETWAQVVSTGLLPKSCWMKLMRADGTVIGYRRARAWHAVVPSAAGVYRVGSSRYDVSPTGKSRLYVEAMTDFGEGDGEQPVQWSVVIGGAMPVGARPGAMWLAGDVLVGGIEIGGYAFAGGTVFGKTSRERMRGILRLDASTVLREEPAAIQLGDEAAGAWFSFAADQHLVRDPDTAANNLIGTLGDLLAAGTAIFNRPSPATVCGRLGKLETVAAGVPRLSYDPMSLVTSSATLQFRKGRRAVTVSAGFTYAAGSYIALTDTANPARWMRGRVISHVGTLVEVDIYWVAPGASGSASAWAVIRSLGYLPEPARANLASNSETFTTAPGVGSVSKNQPAPDGTNNATLVIEDTTGSEHYVNDVVVAVTAGQLCTWSVFVKAAPSSRNLYLRTATAATATSVFDPVAGAWVGAGTGAFNARGFDVLPGGWYRVWMTVTVATTGTLVARVQLHNGASSVYTGDGVRGLIIFGRQLEVGAYPTSYIPTAGSQVSRSSDNLSIPLSKLPFNTSAFTLFGEAPPNADAVTTNYCLAALYKDGSEIALVRSGTAGARALQMINRTGASNVAVINSASGAAASRFKWASAFSANDYELVANGASMGTASTGSVAVGLTTLAIAWGGPATSEPYGRPIPNIALVPRRVSRAEMIARTTL